MRRLSLLALCSIVSLFAVVGSAQAVVVDMNATGQSSVAYNAASQNGYYGVAMVPGTASSLASAGVPVVTAGAPCVDPSLASDFGTYLPNVALCWHGGTVMHANESFALTWDPGRAYWATTRDSVEQFLKDVAGGSGTLSSPYALTSEYTDLSGRASNDSVYGGGCIDYGQVGGSACQFGNTVGSGPGHDYPSSGCPASGTSYDPFTGAGVVPNAVCLTDAQVQQYLQAMIAQEGLNGHTTSGHVPTVVLLMPRATEVCLDTAGNLCSAGSTAPAQFCSYHGQVQVGGGDYAYVVQPWTPYTGCDEPDLPALPSPPTNEEIALDAGTRLVGALSESQISSIVNPWMTGWYGLGGAEIDDNGCVPNGPKFDTVTIGSGSYVIEREFNNAGVLETDPNALECAPFVNLVPTFVAPTGVHYGDVVQFDGSVTNSTLMVSNGQYHWDFGDGTSAIGASVEHVYAKGGTYDVKLTVTDRGGYQASVDQTIQILPLPSSTPPPPPPPPPTNKGKSGGLSVHIQLMPQALKSVLSHGVAMRIRATEPADGIASLLVPASVARRVHIHAHGNRRVVVGRGTVAGIKNGSSTLHLRLTRSMAKKLHRLRHLSLTVRLTLVDRGGKQVTVDAAGRY